MTSTEIPDLQKFVDSYPRPKPSGDGWVQVPTPHGPPEMPDDRAVSALDFWRHESGICAACTVEAAMLSGTLMWGIHVSISNEGYPPSDAQVAKVREDFAIPLEADGPKHTAHHLIWAPDATVN